VFWKATFNCKRWPIGLTADAQGYGRRSATWRHIMKTLIAALALATIIAAPTFIQSAAAAPNRRDASQSEQYYDGYPMRDWERMQDGW
jgi:hypothetical protein